MKWSFNDGDLPDNVIVDEENKKITLIKVQVMNAGMYKCIMREYPDVAGAEGRLRVVGEFCLETFMICIII